MKGRRLRLTSEQIQRRIDLADRQIQLLEAKFLRDGTLTQQQLDNLDITVEPWTIGSIIPWDDENYRLDAVTPNGDVILTRINGTTQRTR